jgi:serine beta-lactamase-like protein LACTB
VRRRAFAAAVIAALLAASGLAAGPSPQDQVTAYMEELWRSTGTPAISVAVALKGKIIFSEGVGLADLDNLVPANGSTVYNIGSVSKVITAVAVMQLVEQGRVSLDDPIRKYVPELPEKSYAPITIRHLMTHTSGIRHYHATDFPNSEDNENTRPFPKWEKGLDIFKDDPLLFRPGQYYSYSSYAVNLLQGVVEKASGMAFEDYLRRNVWTPAGMVSTSFDVPSRIVIHRARSYRLVDGRPLNYFYNDLTYKFASGGMLSTVEDLVRFGAALNRGSLLKAETTAMMYRSQFDSIKRFDEKGPPTDLEWAQGLMWRIFKDANGRTFINHCGSVKGFNACVVNYPDADLVVALAGNADQVTPGRTPTVKVAQFFLTIPPPARLGRKDGLTSQHPNIPTGRAGGFSASRVCCARTARPRRLRRRSARPAAVYVGQSARLPRRQPVRRLPGCSVCDEAS